MKHPLLVLYLVLLAICTVTWGMKYYDELPEEPSLVISSYVERMLYCTSIDKVCPSTGRTPLMWAIECGYEDRACELIDMGSDIESKDSWGSNAICIAARKGLPRVVGKLIQKGADVNSGTYLWGYSALHEAARAGHIDVAIQLLEAGAQPDIKISDIHPGWRDSRRAQDIARENGHYELCDILSKWSKMDNRTHNNCRDK